MARLDARYRFDIADSFLSFYSKLGLILKSYEIGMPTARINTVKVPGRDGELDLTHALEETTRYDNRKITLTFAIINNTYGEWKTLYNTLAEVMHGKYTEIAISVDYDYYYAGIATINPYKSNGKIGTIVIELDAQPFAWTEVSQFINKTVSGTDLTFNFSNLYTSPHQRIKICNIVTSDITDYVSMKINGCDYRTYTTAEARRVDKIINLDDTITMSGNGFAQFILKGGVI